MLESQPQWPFLVDNVYALYIAYVLIGIGTTLAISGFFALGFFGTYLGKILSCEINVPALNHPALSIF